ncbi:accessory gene regulator ArgB-like protein [Cohnella panacarvi]|uniref:accessory gene regulator ArgB-like protein n=1 Tax=Cohnella panacarvi TaxID=400776 RepID=UPI00047DF523|nr:accessory gene regulator B family protein [Cohnella panacarvi]
MINSISAHISGYIYRNNDRGHVSQDVMKFALIGIFTNSLTIILSLCIGLIDGKFQETCIALAAMAVIRMLAGGYHLPSPELCIVASTVAVTAVPFIPLSDSFIYIFAAVSAVVIWIYAPVDMKNKTRISDRSFQIMKYSGIALVLSNLLVQSDILAVSWFIVALTLISFKGGEVRD